MVGKKKNGYTDYMCIYLDTRTHRGAKRKRKKENRRSLSYHHVDAGMTMKFRLHPTQQRGRTSKRRCDIHTSEVSIEWVSRLRYGVGCMVTFPPSPQRSADERNQI